MSKRESFDIARVARVRDKVEAEQMLASGGRLRRLAHDMVVDLTKADRPDADSPLAGLSLEAVDCEAEAVAAAAAAATAPGHVDFGIWLGTDRVDYWRRLLSGKGPCGAVLPAPSRLVRAPGGAIAGAAVVTAMKATDWWAGGPWLPEIFVIHSSQGRGIGGLLLGHAMRACAQAGHLRLGLTVSEGNPARHLYERFGFRPFRSAWLIERGHASAR